MSENNDDNPRHAKITFPEPIQKRIDDGLRRRKALGWPPSDYESGLQMMFILMGGWPAWRKLNPDISDTNVGDIPQTPDNQHGQSGEEYEKWLNQPGIDRDQELPIIEFEGGILTEHPVIDREGGMPERVHVNLPSGGMATVSPNASPELLGALDKMVELAKKMPDESGSAENAPTEIPEEKLIADILEEGSYETQSWGLMKKWLSDYVNSKTAALQASLSSIKAERDETFKEYDELLQERDRIRLVSHDARKDRDIFKKESESHFKAWKEATAIIEEKNLEIAEMKERESDFREHLEMIWNSRDNTFLIHAVRSIKKLFTKYPKKEEEK